MLNLFQHLLFSPEQTPKQVRGDKAGIFEIGFSIVKIKGEQGCD